jgi:hypothetical protein
MKTDIVNPLLNETFVFRPLHEGYDYTRIQGLRYANGRWIPDDGEYDLAFVISNFAYYVALPQYSNLLWTWSDAPLAKKWLPEYLHRYAESWHSMTIDNTPTSDDYRRYSWEDDDPHPNRVAGRSAMNKACELHHCANGRSIRIDDAQYDTNQWIHANEYIKRGVLKIQRTMQPVTLPIKLECYLCADNGKGHLIQALQDYKDDLGAQIEDNEQQINKAETTIYDCEYENEQARKKLPTIIAELNNLGVIDNGEADTSL